MRSYAINSFIYMNLLEKELNVLYGLKLGEFRILVIIDSEQELNKRGFCSIKDIMAYNAGINISRNSFFSNVKSLISKGFVENIGQKKYKLVITGTGDYLIREFIKSLNRKVREKEEKTGKRLKYSFIDKTY